MKRKILLSIILVLILTISLIIIYPPKKQKIIPVEKETNSSSFISMMIENEEGKYIEKTDITFPKENYIFNPEKSGCENGGTLAWNKEKEKIQASLITSDKCYAYFDVYTQEKYCKYSKENSLVCDILRKKDSTIIYHDGRADYEGMKNYDLEAKDLSYRYSGPSEDINNYVCFGNDEKQCPANNLYRIIGFFKNNDKYEAKLIKADYANSDQLGIETGGESGTYATTYYGNQNNGSEEKDAFVHRYRGNLGQVDRYRWQIIGNKETEADWPSALLNIIHLNKNFIDSFDKIWQEKITIHKWYYKGSTWANIVDGTNTSSHTIMTTYDNELGNLQSDKTSHSAKIGLMYVSDYLYAASPSKWNLRPYNGTYKYVQGDPDENGVPQGNYNGTELNSDYRVAIDENWMYLGLWEWTITQLTDDSVVAIFVDPPGNVGNSYVGYHAAAVRPCFYLETNVKIKSGEGSKESPYRLSWN